MAERDGSPPPSYSEVVKGERRPSEELEEVIRVLEGMGSVTLKEEIEDNVFPGLDEASVWTTKVAEGKEPEKEKEKGGKKKNKERRERRKESMSTISIEEILAADLSLNEADISNLRNENDLTAKWVEEHSIMEMIGERREEPEGMKEEPDASANLLETTEVTEEGAKQEEGEIQGGEAARRWNWSTGRSPGENRRSANRNLARRGGMKARSTSRGTKEGRIEKKVKIEPATGAKRKRSAGGASGTSQPTRRSKIAIRKSCAEMAEERGRRRSNTWSPRRESTRTMRIARSMTRSPEPRSPKSERDPIPLPGRWRPVGGRRPTPHPDRAGLDVSLSLLEGAREGDTTVTSSQLPDLVDLPPSPEEGLLEPRYGDPLLPRGKLLMIN